MSYPSTPSDDTKYTKLDDIFQSAEKEYQRLRSIVEAPSLFDETLYDSDATVRVDAEEVPSRVAYGRESQHEEQDEDADVLSPIPIHTAKSLFDELLSKDTQLRARERCDSDATVRPDDFEPRTDAQALWSLVRKSNAMLGLGVKREVRGRYDSDATVRQSDYLPRTHTPIRTRPRARTLGKASRPDARVVRFVEHI